MRDLKNCVIVYYSACVLQWVGTTSLTYSKKIQKIINFDLDLAGGFETERTEQFRNQEAATLEVRSSRANYENFTTTATTETRTNITTAEVPSMTPEDDDSERQAEEVIRLTY